MENNLLPCAYKALFDLECPMCGAQRSFVLMVQGEFRESIVMYPPLLPVLLAMVFFGIHLFNRNLIGVRSLKFYALFTLVVVMINYFVRLLN